MDAPKTYQKAGRYQDRLIITITNVGDVGRIVAEIKAAMIEALPAHAEVQTEVIRKSVAYVKESR